LDCLNSIIRSVSINNGLEREKLELHPVLAELNRSRWPFSRSCFGAIICIHFLDTDLFDAFRYSLVPTGRLYIETFGGHGDNYLDLPKAGQLRDLLSQTFQLSFYRERSVGRSDSGAVSGTPVRGPKALCELQGYVYDAWLRRSDAKGRLCCKSRKLQIYEFFAKTRNGKQSPIRINQGNKFLSSGV